MTSEASAARQKRETLRTIKNERGIVRDYYTRRFEHPDQLEMFSESDLHPRRYVDEDQRET